MMLEENRAQSSLELLLLIGGGIIIAAVVGFFIKNLYNTGANPLLNSATNKVMGDL